MAFLFVGIILLVVQQQTGSSTSATGADSGAGALGVNSIGFFSGVPRKNMFTCRKKYLKLKYQF